MRDHAIWAFIKQEVRLRTTAIVCALTPVLAGFFGCDHSHAELVDSGADAGQDSGTPDAGCMPAGSGGCFFQAGQEVWVDGLGGTDDAGACCCGTVDVPCQTLTYVMAAIGAGRTLGVTIHAYLSDGGADWPAPESWPISLYLGVKLEASEVYFNYPPSGDTSTAFTIYQWDSEDTSQVVLEGSEQVDGGYLHIGIPVDGGPWGSVNTIAPNFAYAIRNGWGVNAQPAHNPVPLQLSHLWIDGQINGISLGSGGALTLGPLPVHVGTWGQQANVAGNAGLVCSADPGFPSTISDVGANVLQIDGQVNGALFRQGCIATLLHAPSIGFQPDGGPSGCPSSIDGFGVTVENGEVHIGSIFEPATIQCQGIDGLDLAGGMLSFVGTIQNSNCVGAEVAAGLLNIEGTQFLRNFIGVWVNGTGMANITGAVTDVPVPTTFQCIDSSEGGPYPPLHACPDRTDNIPSAPSGAAVANTTAYSSIYLSEIGWPHWDGDAGLQAWRCTDKTYAACTCSGSDCPDGGAQRLPDHTDFAYLSTNFAPFGGFPNLGSLAPPMVCQ